MASRTEVFLIESFSCLVLSGLFTAVYLRFGRGLLWATCLCAACVALSVLFAVGWAYTDESPLGITLLALGAGMTSIGVVVQALAERWPLATVLCGALAGTIGWYLGIIGGYVVWVYIG